VNHKKVAVVAAAALLAAAVGVRVALLAGRGERSAAAEPRPPVVPAARIARGDVSERVLLTGTIRARNAVEVHPEIAGRVEAVHARVGDAVRAGQVLATLAHGELAWQARSALAALEVARANLSGARLEHARTRDLHEGGAASPAALDAAKVKLALAEAQVAQAEAGAGLAEERVRDARIVSPIAGVVTRRPVDVGAQVGPQTVVFAVEDVSALKLESSADAEGWSALPLGARAEVTVDARPGEIFPGRVSVRSPSLDPATRRATVEIEISNASGKLLAGSFARAVAEGARREGALVAPREAVVEGPGGAVVWRIVDGRAEAVKPRLGPSDGRAVVVLEGLAEGDLVVTAGQGSLAHGAPAEAAEGVRTASAAAPAAALD
jgi:membrane fusion protein (multidrug efflux system)